MGRWIFENWQILAYLGGILVAALGISYRQGKKEATMASVIKQLAESVERVVTGIRELEEEKAAVEDLREIQRQVEALGAGKADVDDCHQKHAHLEDLKAAGEKLIAQALVTGDQRMARMEELSREVKRDTGELRKMFVDHLQAEARPK